MREGAAEVMTCGTFCVYTEERETTWAKRKNRVKQKHKEEEENISGREGSSKTRREVQEC